MVLWVYVIAGSFGFVGLLPVGKGAFPNSFAYSRYSVLPIELPCLKRMALGLVFFLLCLIWLLSLRSLLFSVKEMKGECI